MADVDVVIIGAGHNGLTCAAYLGMAGLSVRVVERRGVVGGTAVTEEFHPGFRNSVAAYTVSLLQPKVIRDLDAAPPWAEDRRAPRAELPAHPGRPLSAHRRRPHRSAKSPSSARATRSATPNSSDALSEVADLLRELVLQAPPNVTLARHAALAARGDEVRADRRRASCGFDGKARRALFDLYRKSAGDYLDGWFETDAVKALFGFDSIVGNLASPYTRGSAYVLLHHWFGEVNGKKGVWGHAIGGMGAITQAMAKAAGEHGVRIDTGAAVRRSSSSAAAPPASCSATARRSSARAVIANVNPKFLFEQLVPRDAVPGFVTERMRRWKARLRHVPHERRARPRCRTSPRCPAAGDHLTSGIILAPSLGLHGPRLSRRRGARLQPGADRRNPDPLDARRQPRAAGRACGEPVLPARRAGPARRQDATRSPT